MEEQQQRDQSRPLHHVGRHKHRGRKGHHHLRVRGHGGGRCGGGGRHVYGHEHKHHGKHGHGHGHKHHGKHGHGHGSRKGHGHGHGCANGDEEQIEHGEQIIVAPASGGVEQPQPESSQGDIQPHHRHGHHRCHRRHRRHSHPPHHCQHGGQVTETGGAPNELSGAIVRLRLEDEPNE